MARRKRTNHEVAGAREARAIAASLGAQTRTSRRARRLTQAHLGQRVGLSQSEISHLEAGHGDRTSIATWSAVGMALGRPLTVGFSRDLAPEPRDAGHLAAQELLLRYAAMLGRTGSFELATRPANPALSVDVCLRDDRHRILIVAEIWNRLEDIGAASRGMARKIAEVIELAAADDPPAEVRWCWLLVDTAANRAIVRRYPAILRAQFSGSSLAWVRALADGAAPPDRPGIAWIDPRAGRLTERRR